MPKALLWQKTCGSYLTRPPPYPQIPVCTTMMTTRQCGQLHVVARLRACKTKTYNTLECNKCITSLHCRMQLQGWVTTPVQGTTKLSACNRGIHTAELNLKANKKHKLGKHLRLAVFCYQQWLTAALSTASHTSCEGQTTVLTGAAH